VSKAQTPPLLKPKSPLRHLRNKPPITVRRYPRRLGGYKTLPFGFASHGDDDFSSSVSLFQITYGLGDSAQRIRSVGDRRDLSGFEQLLQDGH
jgi:hypothetical protein